MSNTIAVLLLNTVANFSITKQDALAQLPDDQRATATVFDAADEDADAPLAPIERGQSDDWSAIAKAVRALASKARDASLVYVTGRARLPALALLGYELTIAAPVVFLHPPHYDASDALECMNLRRVAPANDAVPLFRVHEHTPSDRHGAVVVVLTCGRKTRTTREQASDYAAAQLTEHALLDVVFCECSAPMSVDNSGTLAHEAFALLREQMRAEYPYCDAWALLIDGPGPLALAVGRAVDKTIGGDEPVHVPVLAGRSFVPAIVLVNQQQPSTSPQMLAYDFFQDNAKLRMLLQRMQSGERFDDFLHRLGYSASEIAVYRGKPVGDGVRDAFDKWLHRAHTMNEFWSILEAMKELILVRELSV